MKKTLLAVFMLASAVFGSGLFNPPTTADMRKAGAVLAANGIATNLTLDGWLLSTHNGAEGALTFGLNYSGAGAAFFGLQQGINWPDVPLASGLSTFCLGTQAGIGSTGQNCVFAGYNTGAFSSGDSTLALGEFAGMYAESCRSIYIGSGAGAYSDSDDEIQIGNFGSQGQPVGDDGAVYTSGYRDSSPETKVGYIGGNLIPRGTNVTTAVLVTNLVQQRTGSGYVTNIILEGITAKVIQ